MDDKSDKICSLCWKVGVNFIKGDEIVNLKEFLAYYNILINEKQFKVCDFCVEVMNGSYSQYLNDKAKSNIFVTIQELPKQTDSASNHKDSGESSSKEVFDGDESSKEFSDDEEKSSIAFSEAGSDEMPDLSSHSDIETSDSESSLIRCEICNEMVSNLNEHNVSEHPKTEQTSRKGPFRSYNCPECGEACARIFELRSHLDNNHPNFFLCACKTCTFKTNHPQTLAAHVRKEHRSSSTSSDKESASEAEVPEPEPERKHHKARKCPECTETFMKFDLNRHMDDKHPGVFLFSCDNCDFKINYGQTMAAHKRRQQCVEYSLEKMFGS